MICLLSSNIHDHKFPASKNPLKTCSADATFKGDCSLIGIRFSLLLFEVVSVDGTIKTDAKTAI